VSKTQIAFAYGGDIWIVDRSGGDARRLVTGTGLYDLGSGKAKRIEVRVAGDMPQVLPHFEKVEKQILSARISPTGQRAVFEAHGEILTVPAEKGDIRNLTRSPAVAERDPAWSPDGKSIAYFSDESGEYALHIGNQDGLGPVRKIELGQPPSFYYSPTWAPDNKKIAYSDKRRVSVGGEWTRPARH
jgi:tricorn protease